MLKTINTFKSKKSEIKYIIIAICTYKRSEKLERLLKNLCKLKYPDIKTSILVVDNDYEKSAFDIYQKFKHKLNILYCNEPQKGFSNTRNKALTESINLNATHLAFIDDDEISTKNWLINHIDFYNKFKNIYISSGPTYKKFDKEYPNYIKNNKTFKVVSHKALGQIKKTCASGNVFFPLNIVKENNIYFSETFNFLGSEDTDFFSRLNHAGYTIGWNYNAINYEIVGEERANIKWIIKRAFHNGYSVSVTRFINKKNKYKIIYYIMEKSIMIMLNAILIPFSLLKGYTGLLNSYVRLIKNYGKLYGAIVVLKNKNFLVMETI